MGIRYIGRLALVLLLTGTVFRTGCPAQEAGGWPVVRDAAAMPWTWWWWHGCAANKADITANLEALKESGIGGVTIVCLLDVKTDPAKKLPYLSPAWVDAVTFAIREARRLGMDADLAPVPGWAFGGPWVPKEESCARIELVEQDGSAGISGPGGISFSAGGRSWALITRRGSSRVRMPVPGGDGYVVDHLDSASVNRYLAEFTKAFRGAEPGSMPRAFMNDSWEISLDWTTGLFGEFRKLRGYDLREKLPEFIGIGQPDDVSRVACDYRETVSDMMISRFTVPFRNWAAARGSLITGETIAEPGNELDINALYDIPQADMGGPRDWFITKGDYATSHFFRRAKIPASTAHILGKPLISSETLTCMGPILNTPLEPVKEKIDYDLVAGINQTMFHGITYSPADARWPGWLFYAGTHLGPFNPMWRQGRALCDYIAACQSFLRSGRPDADLLVYFPMHDVWSRRPAGKPSPPGTVTMDEGSPAAADTLWRAGHDFDYVSDRLLDSVRVEKGQLVSPGTSYRAIVVSGCTLMPAATMERIIRLAEAGATVIFHRDLPSGVPGMGDLAARRLAFGKAINRLISARAASGNKTRFTLGKGTILMGGDIRRLMTLSGIPRETMTDAGLRYIRRKDSAGTTWFIANPAENRPVDGWITLTGQGKSVVIYDPLTGASGKAEFRARDKGTEVRLQLEPRQTCIVRLLASASGAPAWRYRAPAGNPVTLSGPWQVKFIAGGEILPHAETIGSLTSWTTLKSDQSPVLRSFSGTAIYSLTVPTPSLPHITSWELDLGTVYHTSRVTLNGKRLGDLFSRPMRVEATSLAAKGSNLLEIEVSNAPVNRAAALDIAGTDWMMTLGEDAKTWTIGDFLFPWIKKDSSWVPEPSGLIGPVRLVPVGR